MVEPDDTCTLADKQVQVHGTIPEPGPDNLILFVEMKWLFVVVSINDEPKTPYKLCSIPITGSKRDRVGG